MAVTGAPGCSRSAAVDHHLTAGLQPLVNEDIASMPISEHDGLGVDLPLVYQPDKMSLGPLLNGPLRYNDGLGPDAAFEPGADILVGTEPPLGVVKTDAEQEGAGLGVKGRRDKGDPPGLGKDRTVNQNDFHQEVFIFWRADPTAIHLIVIPFQLVLGEAEIGPEG